MTPQQHTWYGQMPGTYVAEEDEEEEVYLQMMNDLAEEESNVGPRQHPNLSQASMPNGQPSGSQPRDNSKQDSHRGLTRTNANGELEWLATADSDGALAVRHDDIRPQLIAIAESERAALGVEYENPDEPGPGKYNVTSFYPKHLQWGPAREDRPEILFAWEEDRETNPRPKCPGQMYWEQDGKKYVVLDPHDNPAKDWDIPATIASNIPGYKLEAMRRGNMSLGHKDFWARMPSRINVDTGNRPVWEELGHPNSSVNMPMERFRFHAGLSSWTERRKTLTIKAGLKKLYGAMLQNNSIRAFGRDLTTKEITEIKKGDNAQFPIAGDVVPAASKASKKRKREGAAGPMETKGQAIEFKTQSRKRKQAEEETSSEEEILPPVRPHKRARKGKKNDSIAAEVDDLVMFEQIPTIIDQDDTSRRYPLRSTRRDSKIPKRVEPIEDVSDESSTDEDSEEEGPTQRHASRKTRQIAKARRGSRKANRSPRESSSEEEEGNYVPTWIEGGEDSISESSDVDSASRESSVERDEEEERMSQRCPFRRIPGAGDVGGKSKGPSWVSSTVGGRDDQGEGRDHRKAVVSLEIDGRIHHATYEGLISNGPVHRADGSNILPQREGVDTSLPAQNESGAPQPHPFDLIMNMPFLNERNLEEEDTPLQAHRKRVREFLGEEDEDAEAYAPPPSKRLRTEQSVPPQVAPPPLLTNPRPVNRSGSAPHARSSEATKQRLDAEQAQVLSDLGGSSSVNYSAVAPRNDEEIRSLIDVLLPTREVYIAWTGQSAPRTDAHQSYRAQFGAILGSFENWWTEHRPNEPVPILAGVMHFGRSVDDWEPPSKDSIYYEAFKNGYRAQRGDVSDRSGPGLEDAFRTGY